MESVNYAKQLQDEVYTKDGTCKFCKQYPHKENCALVSALESVSRYNYLVGLVNTNK